MSTQTLVPIALPFITILFLLAIGAGMRRHGLINPSGARQMTGLVLNVSLPALIWVTLASEITPRELARAPLLVAMGVLGPLLGYVLAGAVARWPLLGAGQRATFQTAVAVTNTALIGYPLCQALLGSTGLVYAVLYDVGLTVVMSTLSIWLLSRARRQEVEEEQGPVRIRSAWIELLRSPMMWALVLGVGWGALGWPTPDWLLHPLRTLGQCTTPLALLTVGVLIQPVTTGAAVDGRPAWPWRPLLALALLRLLVIPALVAGLVVLLRVERVAATVIVLQTAVPSAVATTAMAEQYGGDGSLASAGVVTTTLLSLLTLPLWSAVMLGRP